MKVIKACSICVVVASVLCAAYSFGQSQKAILNAKQLGIEDLDLYLGLDEDLAVAEPVALAEVEEEVSVVEIFPEVSAVEDEVSEVETLDAMTEEVEEASVVEIFPEVSAVGDEVSEVETLDVMTEEVDVFTLPIELAVEEPEALSVEVDSDEDIIIVEEVEVSDLPTFEIAPVAIPVETPDAVAEEEPVAEFVEVEEVVEAAPVSVPMVTPVDQVVAPSETDIAISELASLENAKRRLFDQHGQDCIVQGDSAMLAGHWDQAADRFKEALKFIGERSSTIDIRRQTENKLAEAYYRKALDMRSRNRIEDAETAARESKAYNHPKADKFLADLQSQRENPSPPPPAVHERRWNQTEYRQSISDIKERMKIAKGYYATGELSKCRGEVELVLKDYPWYEDAVNMLRKISLAEHRYVDNERIAAREEMIKDVTRAWAARTYGKDFLSATPPPEIGNNDGSTGITNTQEMRILEKMKSIVIPELNFREANITDVVTALIEASREHDRPELSPEERGVNIVLNLGADAVSTSPSISSDPWAAAAAPVMQSGGIPPLTINVRHISLLSALDLITDAAKLKYRIRDNVVMIMEANRPDAELIHRMYNVLPTIQERVAQITGSSNSSGGGSGGGIFGGALTTGDVSTTTDWKKFFGDLGVAWPDGSTCQYMSSIGKLVVQNTSRNLSTLESVLSVLNVTPRQVEIEVRFVEVMQSDLDSLGFEWGLRDDWEIAEMKDDAHLPAASRRRLTMGAGSITKGFNYLSNNTTKEINAGSAILDNVATFTSILTNPEVSMVLHMLSSKQNTDLLSAPKVVAQAGFKATIKVVVEYIYPSEYNVEMLESTSENGTSTTYTGAVVEPQNFTMREVGVILEVTPEVTPDGSMINLTLAPSVVSEPTWKNYGSTYPVMSGEYVQLPMEQPFFPVRSLATSVQIYNGATVVMGGMITEERHTMEDKIPLLGDIPLIGHLFRNKYDLSEKRNLLLFVTARLVDPAGREVKEAATTALLPTAAL